MLQSSTVENYLKAIYQGVASLPVAQSLLPMGHLAAALGVAPGTATAMVKTLSESGLVQYEPYAGVTLTPAGEKLAALVVRRHRVIELFLVTVMGYRWDEVHDEAEHLEHVVSERLIDRMHEMLGRPDVDPHGDPIPDANGVVKSQEAETLLTCPLNTRVTVTRVIDQDKTFLRFIESHNLKPGEAIRVEARDAAADSVRVRGKNDEPITIGTRAASKLLVHVAVAVAALLGLDASAGAQTRPFEILDNSFLVEEAFNQEAGVVQTIVGVVATGDRGWETAVTQEWPLRVQRHQIAFTLPYGGADGVSGVGDLYVHYRLQATTEAGRVPAFSPRFSVILPTGDAERGLGRGDPGWQLNLPFSKQLGDLYVHWNAGFTHHPGARVEGAEHDLFSPSASASGIWRVTPMFNLMVESVLEWEDLATSHERSFTVSPGFRTGWNAGDAQAIIGIAAPVTRVAGRTDGGVFAYFSYELPFSRQP